MRKLNSIISLGDIYLNYDGGWGFNFMCFVNNYKSHSLLKIEFVNFKIVAWDFLFLFHFLEDKYTQMVIKRINQRINHEPVSKIGKILLSFLDKLFKY